MSKPAGQESPAATTSHDPITSDEQTSVDEAEPDAVGNIAEESVREDGLGQGLHGLGIVDPTPVEDAPKEEGHPTSPKVNRDGRDASIRRGRIERQASEHLARRAAEMSIHDDQPNTFGQSTREKNDLPASPPPPPLPKKDDPKPQEEFDEKRPPAEDNPQNAIPEPPQGSSEATGAEILNIMDQFESGTAGLGEKEIMSPRLERQSLVLPPRSSSLENRDGPFMSPLSPQGTGQSVRSVVTMRSEHSVPASNHDDTASVASLKASSIFQPPPPNPDPEPALPFDFHRFLEQLRHRTADPVARYLRSFLSEFGKKQWMVHEQVKIISDFLDFITKKMAQCEVWRTVSDAEFDNAREGMEKLVMNRLYSQTFSAAIPQAISSPRKGGKGRQADAANPHGPGRRGQHQEDVERDDVIVQKMRIYGWIREEHLDIKSVGDKGRKFLTLAQQELLKINTYRAPRDKVICVLNCCKVIFGYLKNSKADQSADAFIPLLIYTVLQARPEHLNSNVQYIWRFRNQDKLGGEAGYYMSSLTGVVTFIENLDRTTLTISDEEFERNVEQAVSAIAERNKAEEYEKKAHTPPMPSTSGGRMQHFSEKSTLSRPEVTPRNSLDGERSSPRRQATQRLSEKSGQNSSYTEDDDSDAVSGLLRTIQKPLSSIGRMFSDEPGQLRPSGNPASTPRRLSPAPNIDRPGAGPRINDRSPQRMTADEAAARQASAETAEAQRVRAREYTVVVETLQSMFPNLDQDVIQDVVAAQEGNVGKAVDACLAMSGG